MYVLACPYPETGSCMGCLGGRSSSPEGAGLLASDSTDVPGQFHAVLHTPGPLWEQATACLQGNRHHPLASPPASPVTRFSGRNPKGINPSP